MAKSNFGNNSKKWQECETIAGYLRCEKRDVFYKLHHKLEDAGILAGCLSADERSLKRARQLLAEAKDEKLTAANDGIKMALWFVAKFENPHDSMDALKKAFKVLGVPLTRRKHEQRQPGSDTAGQPSDTPAGGPDVPDPTGVPSSPSGSEAPK